MSKLIDTILTKTNKTISDIKNDLISNQKNESQKLPQIEPSPFNQDESLPTTMEIYNRLDKRDLEIEILPQTELYLNYLKTILNIEDEDYNKVIDEVVILFYESLKEEL